MCCDESNPIHVPLVALSNNVVGMDGKDQFDQVGFDDFSATLEATRYLIGEGHHDNRFRGGYFPSVVPAAV